MSTIRRSWYKTLLRIALLDLFFFVSSCRGFPFSSTKSVSINLCYRRRHHCHHENIFFLGATSTGTDNVEDWVKISKKTSTGESNTRERYTNTNQYANRKQPHCLSRRDWLMKGVGLAVLSTTAVISFDPAASAVPATTASANSQKAAISRPQPTNNSSTNNASIAMEISELEKVVSENAINVTKVLKNEIIKETTCESIDRKTYTRIKVKQNPWFIPKIFQRKVITNIPNSDLLVSGIIAGSLTEIVRTAALYPLDTIKKRIQADPRHHRSRTVKRKLQRLFLVFLRKMREGDLYAGIVPSILVAVPSSGVYCGIRDVTKRIVGDMGASSSDLLTRGPASVYFASITSMFPYYHNEVLVSLVGALVADVASLAVRTPADVLALRLQVGRRSLPAEQDGADDLLRDAWRDGWNRLPAVIITDLPYLLSRIALNYMVTSGHENIGRYELVTIAVACGCAALTTPLEVARIRILVNQTSDESSEHVSGGESTNGVLRTMVLVARENNGGLQNLFAGWIERTVYYGIGRAWLDPIRVIGYLGIRDAVLLRWFE